jgi:hypothetical protein
MGNRCVGYNFVPMLRTCFIMMGVLVSLYGGNLEGANSGLTNNEELAWDLAHQQASAS